MADASNKFEILCSKCGEIPEVLRVHTDNSKIELNCKNCGKYELLIDEYTKNLSNCNFNFCQDCLKRPKINYYYCFVCKKDYCEKCKTDNHSSHECIESKEKKKICLNHNKEFQYFCFNCNENICEEDIKEDGNHKKHDIEEISKLKESKSLNVNKAKIIEINTYLKNLVEFNDLLLNKAKILQNKDFYKNSIKNMGQSLEEGNKRNSKDIIYLLKRLSGGIDKSLKAIDALIDKDIHLHRNDKYLPLNNKELDNKDFKNISQISFNQLKEIDLSENNITNIQPFKKMSLPFLEFLNLSHNKIEKIEPITKLNSKNLKYIFLQKNNINDIEKFSNSNYEKIELLRVEDYNNQIINDEIKKTLEKINSKYPDRFIYKKIDEQKKEFKDKYEQDISWDNEFIDLCDLKGGKKILKDLLLIITYMPKNNISKLILRNNDIKDPSMLKLVNFNKLQILDLAVNNINNLDFLLEMKAENLKYLYIDNNEFKEIHQIINANFPKLEVLSINENYFDLYEMKESPIYKKLELKNLDIKKKKIIKKENENNKDDNKNIERNKIENNEKKLYIQLDRNENKQDEQNSNS